MNLETLLTLLAIVIIGWYLSFLASRLDRLHHRVETSWATLDSFLQQRAALAQQIVAESNLDPATAYLISTSTQSQPVKQILLKGLQPRAFFQSH